MLTLLALAAWAQTGGRIQGQVTDAQGHAIPGAQVTATNRKGGAALHATTDAQGNFTLAARSGGTYTVKIANAGFKTLQQQVTVPASGAAQLRAQLTLATVVQSVMVRATNIKGATVAPSQQAVFKIPQSLRVLNREQINALSPVAGSAQILSVAPGVNVTGFGNTGATKSTVTVNGVQQGWTGFGGYTTAGDIGITFDEIPVADPATGLWQSNMFPESALINSTSVTYGPGDPDQRWYNNVGGGVEYTPLQPTQHMHGTISQTFGNYGEESTDAEFTTGLYRGWSAVFAGGHGSGDSFRQGTDGFTNPNSNYAAYGKIIHAFSNGDLQFGGYYSYAQSFRPQVIPTAPVAGVTVDGTPTGTLYSQQTSGFFSTVPQSSYAKHDGNQMALFWNKLDVDVNASTVVSNSVWYERINRLHDRRTDIFAPGPQQLEWNDPFTKNYGDKLTLAKTVSYNAIVGGVYYIHSLYNSRNNFYNPADGGSQLGIINIGGKFRSSYFSQDQAAVFVQDRITPVRWLTLTPGVRSFNNQVAYSNGVYSDFAFAPGVVPSQHCAINGTYFDNSGATPAPNASDQGASCDSTQSRSGWEPSMNAAIFPTSWLNLYGGYAEELRTPALGGGGGMFQAVDAASYTLARAEYSQAGFKMHFSKLGSISNLLLGGDYYHLLFKNQELSLGLGNGDTLYATASSRYNGFNWFLDADATSNFHLFVNSTFEGTLYSNWDSCPAGQAPTPACNFTGLKVPYVPDKLLNVGGYYTLPVSESVVVQPRVWYQYTSAQNIFDNVAGAPSAQTMPGFGTLNLGANVPIQRFNLRFTALNVTNRQYNQFLWVSAGGYLGGKPGYLLAYPGAPFTVYGTLSVHF